MSDEPPGCRERDTDGRARRWAWNAADVRGEVEQLIGGAGALVDAAVRRELTEDLTARAVGRCVPSLAGDGTAVPEHPPVGGSLPRREPRRRPGHPWARAGPA